MPCPTANASPARSTCSIRATIPTSPPSSASPSPNSAGGLKSARPSICSNSTLPRRKSPSSPSARAASSTGSRSRASSACSGGKSPLPELLTRIKIDLRRLFVTVIDHSTGPEHQLLFFKERFLAKDQPDRPKMDRFSAKLRKLGLREETIGYGPTKETWKASQHAP
jgi:hypothetical protein